MSTGRWCDLDDREVLAWSVDTRTLLDVTTSSEPATAASRAERKLRTRQALLESALRLTADRGFASLSLREVAKDAGIVPTAFYRHFTSMEDLGIALVEESMRSLRSMIRDARRNTSSADDAIRSSVHTLHTAVRGNEAHFRFLARERYGGVGAVQAAIATELRLFVSELAVDLGRFDVLNSWTGEDLRMMADLLVTAMLATMTQLVDVAVPSAEADAEILRTARKQLRLVVLGVMGWRSDPQE